MVILASTPLITAPILVVAAFIVAILSPSNILLTSSLSYIFLNDNNNDVIINLDLLTALVISFSVNAIFLPLLLVILRSATSFIALAFIEIMLPIPAQHAVMIANGVFLASLLIHESSWKNFAYFGLLNVSNMATPTVVNIFDTLEPARSKSLAFITLYLPSIRVPSDL